MNISSMLFLTAFLPAVFLLDRLCMGRGGMLKLKNVLLLLASLLFYAWGEPACILLLLFSIALNYGFGLWLGVLGCGGGQEGGKAPGRGARPVLALGVAANLALLGYYKYLNFFLHLVNRLAGTGFPENRQIPLPIGISFFTFGAIAYLADLYRGLYPAEKNPVNMALYMSFFPKVSVGPIVRYRDFGPQLRERRATLEKTAEGIRRFAYGLGKKVLIANVLGAYVDRVYDLEIGRVSGAMAWSAALLYTLQIYYDFSGFSDMAVGLSKMFGFEICENFHYPYLSGSVQEFWRRWHISLSTWFRDYLYIPLGGNRKGKLRTYVNLGIVFLATGLWHGASTAFLFWGALHGFFMILERLGLKKLLERTRVLKYLYTGLVVAAGWVIFRVASLGPALTYLVRMAAPWRFQGTYLIRELMSNRCLVTAAAGVLGMGLLQKGLERFCPRLLKAKGGAAELAWCLVIVALSALYLVNNTYNPAIYLKF